MALNAAASGWEKRRAPHRSGVRLIVGAGASSSQACMGLGLVGLKMDFWTNGLDLGELGSDLSVLGLVLRLRISQIHSEEVFSSLAFETRIFSSSYFRCGPQTEHVYNMPPSTTQNL